MIPECMWCKEHWSEGHKANPAYRGMFWVCDKCEQEEKDFRSRQISRHEKEDGIYDQGSTKIWFC